MSEKTFEKIIYYKCGCNSKTHQLAFGERNKKKAFNKSSFEKIICRTCNAPLRFQKAEQLTVENNQVTREVLQI